MMSMLYTLIILAIASALFITGRVRSDLVAICALLALMMLNILTPAEALSGFSNSVVIMMIGLFIVGGGIFQTGLAKMVSGRLLRLAGGSEWKLLITVMIVTAMIGAFVSNTGTVALMLPIVVSLAAGANISPGRLLMPLAFASSMGGMLTLIGTPPNLVISDQLLAAGYERLSFFSFTPVGLICLGVGITSLLFLSRWFLGKSSTGNTKDNRLRSPGELARQYQLGDNLFRVQVMPNSTVCGRSLQQLDTTGHYKISVIEIRRKSPSKNPFFKTINQQMAGPATVVQAEDILYIFGDFDHAEQFVRDHHLQWADAATPEQQPAPIDRPLDFKQLGIAEILLTPNSGLLNQRVSESGFREKYQVNILGIQRRNRYLLQDLKDERMRFGDALLVQGTWENIALLDKEQDDLVVVGQPLAHASAVTLDHKAPIAAGIMLLMVLMMVLEWVPAVVSVMLAAVLMIVTGCLRSIEEAYKSINWESIVLIGGMIPMSLAIEKTGASTLLSEGLVSLLGDYGPLVLLAGIYITTSILTMFISNTACAVLLAPIALSTAVEIGVSPLPFLFAVAVAASMCFASPFSTPPNALVMSAGRYSFIDYIKVGLPLQVIMAVVMIAALPFLFPF